MIGAFKGADWAYLSGTPDHKAEGIDHYASGRLIQSRK